ncbi:MAG: YVTN family beta-propeller protein [Pseudoalteromonas tetraodonis]|jgi:YVTN family beta-propeller protein
MKRFYLPMIATALIVGAAVAENSAAAAKIGHPSLMSPHASPIAVHGARVFVANTPADSVDVIDTRSRKVIERIDVGIDPVSIAIRPDGKEIWVANHVSDSVSVIDNSPTSPTYLRVIATVQEFLPIIGSTRFDEPVGIAFASNTKAYVALSSENSIAVVDVPTRKVIKRLKIPAQDPRAIVVRGERLYVIPFESNNKTQLSGGYKIDGDLVTFNAHEHSIANNNVLSLGHVLDIIKHPKVPDHDLFIYDTTNDQLIETVDTLGTLLYGLAVDSNGRVFVAQTDARNDANGRSGTKKHGLAELQNRAFLNQITKIEFDGDSAKIPSLINLEPLPPLHPEPDKAFATPFAIQVSDDDSFLIASAAGSDKIFTVDTASGEPLGQVKVGSVPRGIALQKTDAWVLNVVGNSVSLVDLSDPAKLEVTTTIQLHDPTHLAFKRGRIAFNTAAASTTKTFSCASCHPDGHTDQLLWVLKTPLVTGGDQIMPRSTMPLRGLRDTAPFHWDGIPGDPFGGNNSASVYAHADPNCSADDPVEATRHVVDASLASTMAMDGDTGRNDEGKLGSLTAAERDDLAKFLLNIPFPPAQKRPYTNVLSKRAVDGFELFHIKGNHEGKPRPNVCGNCHRMPFLVSTNTPGTGMDAPTWRGASDRFLILPQGRLNIIDFDFYRRIAERGIPEREMWRFSWRSKPRFDPVWDMVLQGSTGFSGTFARQVTVSSFTVEEKLTDDLLGALEASAREGAIVLQVEGVFLDGDNASPITLQFEDGHYVQTDRDRSTHTREKLLTLARRGKFIGTFTGRHGANADYDHPQPALWTLGPIHEQRGRQEFPILYGQNKTMTISGRHVRDGASVIVDGRKIEGSVKIGDVEEIVIELSKLPAIGMHLLQVQNPYGLFSNDFIFHVTRDESTAGKLRNETSPGIMSDALIQAIRRGDLVTTKRLVRRGAGVNTRHPEDGSIPLSAAALYGHLEVTNYLIGQKARVNHSNRDGNTPLHVAAFLCRPEVVKSLLANGASTDKRNHRREFPIDVVSGKWTEELSGFYFAIAAGARFEIDLEEVERLRPQIAKILRDHDAKSE